MCVKQILLRKNENNQQKFDKNNDKFISDLCWKASKNSQT